MNKNIGEIIKSIIVFPQVKIKKQGILFSC